MQFKYTEEQLMIKQAARDFAQTELKPGVIERDDQQKFPAEQIKKLGELGFLGMMVSPQYGCYIIRTGHGRNFKDRCIYGGSAFCK
jgi:alkylation response protein AidB-like acyl-CoA dehydrogenase